MTISMSGTRVPQILCPNRTQGSSSLCHQGMGTTLEEDYVVSRFGSPGFPIC